METGTPSNEYPFHWSIYQWIEGENAYEIKPNNLNQAAKDLAHFILKLQSIPTQGAPKARRGYPLDSQDKAVREALKQVSGWVDISTLELMWDELLNVPSWSLEPRWFHGDLLPQNLLVNNGVIHAVIDFGLMGIGDPACDLLPAWSLLDANSRSMFKKTLNVDEHTWERGKGWSLLIALIILPVYRNRNQVLVDVAEHMINELLLDRKK